MQLWTNKIVTLYIDERFYASVEFPALLLLKLSRNRYTVTYSRI